MRKQFFYTLGLTLLTALIFQGTQAQNSSPYWSAAGNSNASTSSKLGTTNAIPLRFLTKNSERLRIDTLGRVGIGTTAPGSQLQINAASGVSPLKALINGSTKLYMSSGGGLSVGSGTGAPSNGLYVSGNVGIGTATPTKKLQVVGTSLFTSTLTVSDGGLSVKNTTGSLGNAALDASGSLYGITSQGGNYGVYASSTSGVGVFGSSTSGKGVQGSGGTYGVYGIGPNNPGTGIGAGVYGSGYFGVQGVSSSYIGVFGSGYNEGGHFVGDNTNSSSIGVLAVGSTEGVYGTGSTGVYGSGSQIGVYGGPNGVIGVQGEGTTGVYGKGSSIGVYGTSSSYAGYFVGNVYCSGTYLGSDRKLKKNITDFTSAMDIISKLQPKSYEYRQDGNYKLMNLPEGKHYGLIAQDVEQVLPNLVKDTKFDVTMAKQSQTKPDSSKAPTATSTAQPAEVIDFKAVNYTELIPIVIKGMQELNEKNTEIDALKTRIDNLEELVNRLAVNQATNGTTLTSAYLEQNTPNPVNGTTIIRYHIPQTSTSAILNITDAKGQLVKTLSVTNSGSGQVNVNTSMLASGTYNYTLYVDGKSVDTKRLMIAR
jgi:Chaperone of endosialidase/Secretion system C-terminal sorting domain